MYSTDWSGHYPESLSQLTPNYLAKIPECGYSYTDTYSAGYQTGPKAPHNSKAHENYFYIECQEPYHKEAGIKAACNSVNGILE